MKTFLLLSTLLTIATSCNLFEDKEKKAIEICQQNKIPLSESLAFKEYGLSPTATWLDFGNMIAQQDPNKKLIWKANEVGDSGVYLVAFVDEKGWGQRWEVTLEQKIVKYMNANEYLSRKYGLSRKGNSNEFKVLGISLDTLKFENRYYYSSEPIISYELKGKVINNTDKVITEGYLEGTLKLVFEEKTIAAKQSRYDGFTSRVSESSPWNPGETREFKFRSYGIELIYTDYPPAYALFEIGLTAVDPVGYKFNQNIEEFNMKKKWIEFIATKDEYVKK